MNIVEDLKWRELIYATTDPEILNVLQNEKVTFYLGADPTGDSLHIGHLFPYLTAKRLEAAGHKAILLIGGATGLIGDPRGTSERQLLSLEKSLSNAASITKQVRGLFNCEMVNNYDWIGKIDMITFLRDYGKCFNVNYMLNKETVKARLETGISYTEFSYQILQSMDFMHLYENKNVTLQIGGQDQWGNITAGIELIRKHHPDAKVFGLTVPLITNADGTKFGKSEGAPVWLDPEKTSPYEFYQYWINVPDSDVIKRLKQFTFLTKEEIEDIEKEFKEHPETRRAQKELAKNITITIHGEEAYKQAVRISEALFSGDISNLSLDEIHMGFKNIKSAEFSEDVNILDALINTGLASSKREAREFVTSGAISINGNKVDSLEYMVTKNNALYNEYSVIKRGKKKYSLIHHN